MVLGAASLGGSAYGAWDWSLGFSGLFVFALIADIGARRVRRLNEIARRSEQARQQALEGNFIAGRFRGQRSGVPRSYDRAA